MIANQDHKKVPGIYCIKNTTNRKVYVGKSGNIYRRIVQHLYDLKMGRPKAENEHFRNAWNKYGADAFTYEVLEVVEGEKELQERELYWIQALDSTNRKLGYNLRMDSSTMMVVHLETRAKQAKNVAAQWAAGIRNGHSQKLKDSWEGNTERVENQSALMSKTLTKYGYLYQDLINQEVKCLTYKELVASGLSAIQQVYSKKKTDVGKCKGVTIHRVPAAHIGTNLISIWEELHTLTPYLT